MREEARGDVTGYEAVHSCNQNGASFGWDGRHSECAKTVPCAVGLESDQDVVNSRGFILVWLRPCFVPLNNAWFVGGNHDGSSSRNLSRLIGLSWTPEPLVYLPQPAHPGEIVVYVRTLKYRAGPARTILAHHVRQHDANGLRDLGLHGQREIAARTIKL